ncbi:HipA domain-containing protein [soil metagenome]
MNRIEVGVSVGGQDLPVGLLGPTRRKGRDIGAHFAYHASYLADPSGYAIDPNLPLRSGTQFTRPGQLMFGAFADCAPDRWGRTLLQRAAHRAAAGTSTRDLTEVDYLLGARDDLRQGALRFRSPAGGPFLATEDRGVPALTELSELLDLANRAQEDRLVADELARLVRGGSSLGGARPKAHVRSADDTVAIAKFPSAMHDTWDVMAWEATTLTLAGDAGIAVPPFELLDLAGRSVLVIDRFDRHGPLDGPATRLGYVSAMTMLDARDGEAGDVLDLVDVAEIHSPTATDDIGQLWRRAVFSALVSNTDNHLRNHGYLRTRGGWKLAPAFDLNPNPDRAELAVGVNGHHTGIIDAAVSSSELFRLDRAEALAVLGEVTDAVSHWDTVARTLGLPRAAIDRMRPAFDHPDAHRATELIGRPGRHDRAAADRATPDP